MVGLREAETDEPGAQIALEYVHGGTRLCIHNLRSQSQELALHPSENPGATTREIGKALNISPVTVRYHLKTLRQYELVHRYPKLNIAKRDEGRCQFWSSLSPP